MRILAGNLTFIKGLPSLEGVYFYNINDTFELRIPGQNLSGNPIQSERVFQSYEALEEDEEAWLTFMDSCHLERPATVIFKKGFSGCAC